MWFSLYLYLQLFIIISDPKLVSWEILKSFQLLVSQFILFLLCSFPFSMSLDACRTCNRSLNCQLLLLCFVLFCCFLSLISLSCFFKKKDFVYFLNYIICACLHVDKFIDEGSVHGGLRRALDPLELELLVVVYQMVWVPGSELHSSARSIGVLPSLQNPPFFVGYIISTDLSSASSASSTIQIMCFKNLQWFFKCGYDSLESLIFHFALLHFEHLCTVILHLSIHCICTSFSNCKHSLKTNLKYLSTLCIIWQ